MKTHYNIKFLAVLSIIIMVYAGISCTEDINLPLDTTYVRLVVDGAITSDTTTHKIILSRSGDPLNKQAISYVSNANVYITDGTDTFILTESLVNKGEYDTKPNVYGVAGKTYVLHISNVDVNNDGVTETYSAQSFLKPMAQIDSIVLDFQKFSANDSGYLINLYGWDIGGRNYYLSKASINGTMITDSMKEIGKAVNSGFSGKYYPGLSVYFLDHNKLDERIKPGDTITLELDCITEDYYNYIDAFQQEYVPKTPLFSGPSANVPTNISPKDKAVGFFAAYSVRRKSRIFK